MVEENGKRAIRILMLEDSPLDAELAIARLRKAHLAPEVVMARTRREFEQAVEADQFDLILADYALPDFDGIAALALAREKLPAVPFIFISGRMGEEVAIDTLQRGATDYVLKHHLERLVPAVLRALREQDDHLIRVEAERNYRQSEQRFRHVLEAVPQMIWMAGPDCLLTYTNQCWRDYAPSGVTSWCQPEMIYPADYAALTEGYHRALLASEPFTIETRFLRKGDNAPRWHLVRLTPIADDHDADDHNDELVWLGTATDIQDQKRNEEALRTAEKLSVTGRMAAAIAHEINNPLESMTNLLFLVRLEAEGNPRVLSYLDMTENELERISSITKQTLQFYRDPVVPVPIEARAILDEVLRLFSSRLSSKHIETSLRVDPGTVFGGIKGEIRQVLINLVNNAIDAVPAQGRIDIEAKPTLHASAPAVEMCVHDNGSGISPEQAAQLFTPFFSTKGAHGTGLGLWVSKGIAEKHGGTLSLATTGADRDRRTTARLVLPLEAGPELHNPENTSAPTRL